MKLSFGTDDKKALTGAGLYIKIFQTASLVSAICILVFSVYPPAMIRRGVFSLLFDLAAMSLPRIEIYLLSLFYRACTKETLIFFAILIAALILGIAGRKILLSSDASAKKLRIALATFISADLVLRLIPFSFNGVFSTASNITGFALRLACLIFILLDLKKKKS